MTTIAINTFTGISPKIPPRYLPNGGSQIAMNCDTTGTSIQPIKNVSDAVYALGRSAKTIYRFGQDLDSETQHWLSWSGEVDVIRSQIAGDKNEWTFYTGDGYPKATHSGIVGSGANIPRAFRPLGLPKPSTAPVATAMAYTPEKKAAIVYIGPEILKSFTTRFGVEYSTDGVSYTKVALSSITAAVVASALNGKAGTAVVKAGGVEITSNAKGRESSLFIKYAEDNYAQAAGVGADRAGAVFTLDAGILGQLVTWHNVPGETNKLYTGVFLNGASSASHGKYWDKGTTFNKNALANWLRQVSWLTVQDTGDSLIVTSGGNLLGSSTTVGFGAFRANQQGQVDRGGRGTDDSPAVVEFPASALAYLTAEDNIEYKINNELWAPVKVSTPTLAGVTAAFAAAKSPAGINRFTVSQDGANVRIQTNALGAGISLTIRWKTSLSNILSASGLTLDNLPTESRVYVYTHVSKETDWWYESAPSLPSNIVDVYPDQAVKLTGLAGNPAGRPYKVTHKRIYRATTGAYLFVDEIAVGASSFEDKLDAALLAEECPSLYWSPPPDDLAGIINLPNGIMAGFVGRDIYFCDPYHPHAWPDTYRQTVDYPVVGLGVVDTTLVVLTVGTPYLIQGSHPDSMVVVKTEVEQSCVSKRSIVSTAGGVVYASPDGLVSVAPGGSKIITEDKFTRDQWQALIDPWTLHSYEYEMKYYGFFVAGGKGQSLSYDFATGALVLSDIHLQCGFSDLRRDTLYLASGTTIRKWGTGLTKKLVWRSKKFGMSHIIGFSCAQVEAEGYPVTFTIYADGGVVHTATVRNRIPFRLPAKVGRDWEVEVSGTHEIYNIAFAQSMEEIANV